MKTYQNAIWALALGFALTACRQEEGIAPTLTDDYIRFGSPTISVETRATEGFIDNYLPANSSFGVLGYCLAYKVGTTNYDPKSGASPWSHKRNQCPPSVFYKQEVTVGENGTCTYTNPKKWYTDGQNEANEELQAIELSETENYRYSFFAYYPYGDEHFEITPKDATTAGAPVITYTMPFQSTTNTETELSAETVPDAMLAIAQNVQRSNRMVEFNFSHILTGLGFQVNNYSQVEDNTTSGEKHGTDLRIFSIKLKGTFYRSVTVDMTRPAATITYPADTYSGTYTIFENSEGTLVPWQQDGSKGNTFLTPDVYLRLLSGTQEQGYFGPKIIENGTEKDAITLYVDYQLGEQERTTVPLTRPGNFTPRSGVRYTAQLNWVDNAFVLIMQADNGEVWEDGNNSNDDIVFE